MLVAEENNIIYEPNQYRDIRLTVGKYSCIHIWVGTYYCFWLYIYIIIVSDFGITTPLFQPLNDRIWPNLEYNTRTYYDEYIFFFIYLVAARSFYFCSSYRSSTS